MYRWRVIFIVFGQVFVLLCLLAFMLESQKLSSHSLGVGGVGVIEPWEKGALRPFFLSHTHGVTDSS